MSLGLTAPGPEKSAVSRQSSEGRNPAHPRNMRGLNFEGVSRRKRLREEWLSFFTSVLHRGRLAPAPTPTTYRALHFEVALILASLQSAISTLQARAWS